MERLSRVTLLLALLFAFVLPSGAGAKDSPKSFLSPSGKHKAVFTVLEKKVFTPGEQAADIEIVNYISYRIDFIETESGSTAASVTYYAPYDAQGKGGEAAGLEAIFQMIVWSPGEEVAVIPEEAWESGPGTTVRKAVSLSRALPWKETSFAFDSFFWIDGLTGVGDSHFDCDYAVEKFDGRTGETVPVKESRSPIGYELISAGRENLLIKELADNCATDEELTERCFTLDLATGAEKPADCPPAE